MQATGYFYYLTPETEEFILIKMNLKILLFFSLLPYLASSQEEKTAGWIAEDESGTMQLTQSADTMEIIAPQGLTLWYAPRLAGAYEIRYTACLVMQGGEYDRLSDLNCFWAANDPSRPGDLFSRSEWRKGRFKNYNTLDLFYAGYGGNHNTTTRFRRYHGRYFGNDDSKIKPVLQEYTDPAHLLEPNRWYSIVIRVDGNRTSYRINGEELFSYPLTPGEGDGHFGLRLLNNHARITGFRVKSL